MNQTVILGAGLAGMSTAHHLAGEYELFEREDRPGGLVVTHEREGFRFDVTGHWLHMRDPGIREMVARILPKTVQVVRDSRVFTKGVYTPYPFQTNLYGLPPEVIREILESFVEDVLLHPPAEEPRTFEQWVIRHMGRGIADHFMIPYNEKLWINHPRDMTPHWCQHYVPKPTLRQLLDGALAPPKKVIGYNAEFTYPARGGIGELSRALARTLDPSRVHLSTEPKSISARKKVVTLKDGRTIGYRHLVSSLPLPDLIRLIDDAPARVKQAAARLTWNQVAYFNVAIRGRTLVPAHWVYTPEPPYVFYRIGSYSNAVRNMAPKGCHSLYVEISHRGNLPPVRTLWASTLKGLLRSGFVRNRDDVLFHEFRNIPCAYVVFDPHYSPSLALIHPWLNSVGIRSIGRYGRWTYNSMETALQDGRDAAHQIKELS